MLWLKFFGVSDLYIKSEPCQRTLINRLSVCLCFIQPSPIVGHKINLVSVIV